MTFDKSQVIARLEEISKANEDIAGDMILDLYIDFVEAIGKDDYIGSPNEMSRLISKGLNVDLKA